MEKPASKRDATLAMYNFKRAVVGGISLACILLAVLLYIASPDLNNVLLAATARIGVVMFAIWLAMPQLRGMMAKLPSVLPVLALVFVVLCAARPSQFRIIGSLLVVTTALVGISKWIEKISKP